MPLSKNVVISQLFRLKNEVFQSPRNARIKPFTTFFAKASHMSMLIFNFTDTYRNLAAFFKWTCNRT